MPAWSTSLRIVDSPRFLSSYRYIMYARNIKSVTLNCERMNDDRAAATQPMKIAVVSLRTKPAVVV